MARHPLAPTWPIELHTTLTFRQVSSGTSMLTVVWTPQNASAEEQAAFDAGHQSMTQGWSGTLDKLDAYLAEAQDQLRSLGYRYTCTYEGMKPTFVRL